MSGNVHLQTDSVAPGGWRYDGLPLRRHIEMTIIAAVDVTDRPCLLSSVWRNLTAMGP